MSAMERTLRILSDAADLAILSLFLIVGLIGFLPGIQRRWAYAGAAFVLGIGLGLAARWAPFIPDGLDLLACIIGVISGPVTAARMQGKTIMEVVDEIRRARDGAADGGQGDA